MHKQAAVVLSFLAVTLVSAHSSVDWTQQSTSIRHLASLPPAKAAPQCSTNCADQMTPGKQCWSCTYNPHAGTVLLDYSDCGFTDACCAQGCQQEDAQGRKLLFSTIKPKHHKSHGGFSWFTYGFTGPTIYNRSPSPFGRRLHTFYTKPHWQSCPPDRVDKDPRCCMAGNPGDCARKHICLVTVQYADPAVCTLVVGTPSPATQLSPTQTSSSTPPSPNPTPTPYPIPSSSPYVPTPQPGHPSTTPSSPGSTSQPALPSPYPGPYPAPPSHSPLLSPVMPKGSDASPVSSGSTFPYCPCTNEVPSPFHLSSAETSRVVNTAGNRYCFYLTTTAIPDSSCGTVDLRKLEFDITPSCRGAATDITFDGDVLPAVYQQWQDGASMVLKVVRKDSTINPLGNFSDLVGRTVEVCFTLKDDSVCPTIEEFANNGVVSAAFFGEKRDCCFTVIHPY